MARPTSLLIPTCLATLKYGIVDREREQLDLTQGCGIDLASGPEPAPALDQDMSPVKVQS